MPHSSGELFLRMWPKRVSLEYLFHTYVSEQEASAKYILSQLKLDMNQLTRLAEAKAGLSI